MHIATDNIEYHVSYAALRRGGTIVALAAAPFEDQSARWGVKLATPQVASDPAALTEIVGLVAAGELKPCALGAVAQRRISQVVPIEKYPPARCLPEPDQQFCNRALAAAAFAHKRATNSFSAMLNEASFTASTVRAPPNSPSPMA